MLDHFSIFTRSGLVLWDYTRKGLRGEDPAAAIDHLIEHVFLEDKLSLSHHERDKYRLRWVFSNEHRLCFVVVYPWNMAVSRRFYESLLDLIRERFVDLYDSLGRVDDLDAFGDFDEVFQEVRKICEEEMNVERRLRRGGDLMRGFDGSTQLDSDDENAAHHDDEEEGQHGATPTPTTTGGGPSISITQPPPPSSPDSSSSSPTTTTASAESSHSPSRQPQGQGSRSRRQRRGQRQMRSFGQSAKQRRRAERQAQRKAAAKKNPTTSGDGNANESESQTESQGGGSGVGTKKPRNWDEDLSGVKSCVTEEDMEKLSKGPDGGDDLDHWKDHFGVDGKTDLRLRLKTAAAEEEESEGEGEYSDEYSDSDDDGPIEINPTTATTTTTPTTSTTTSTDTEVRQRRRRREKKRQQAQASTQSKQRGFFGNLFSSLTGSRQLSQEELTPVMRSFRSHLIAKNVAQDVAQKICDSVEQSLIGKKLGTFSTVHRTVKAAVVEAMRRILAGKRQIRIRRDISRARELGNPYVVVFCGVNGVGKSTSLAKIAFWLKQEGLSVMIAACDTFRSGAVEQLAVHARCLQVPLFDKGYGRDSYLVAEQAIAYAEKNEIDVVLVDTAGRMQDNEGLMQALARLIAHNRPDLVLFVGEALVGNQGVDQLVKFDRALLSAAAMDRSGETRRTIDGIVLTKFDTIDDKVGAAVSMVYTSGHPIVFIGVGQKYPDLRELSVDNVIHYLMK